MLFSIFTPTNRPDYLLELYESLLAQKYTNWEWIIVPNGGCRIPDVILENKKVIVREPGVPNSNIGALKRFACSLASGDILVEVDHDDMLLPNCLDELNYWFNRPENYGFVYSDNLVLSDNFIPFNSAFGWTHDKITLNDYKQGSGLTSTECIRMHSFEPSAASMAFIWYAPDHVRAWRKNVYWQIGGHNAEMDVLDDHELLIRTYLHTPMAKTMNPLYIYRHTGHNTSMSSEKNAKIQKGTVELFHTYGFDLVQREADLRGLRKLDLGGGFNAPRGYETVDLVNGDITCDLNEPWPFEDGSVGVLRAHHIFEHLKNPLFTMQEAHRVLADGGWLMVEVPSTDGRGAWCDPTHVSYWNQVSFFYYTRAEQAGYIYNDTAKFQEFRLETRYPNPYFEANHIPCVTFWGRAIKSNERRPHLIQV